LNWLRRELENNAVLAMNRSFQDVILQATGAEALFHIEDIQSLWSGYGKIMRYGLRGADRERVVVKHVKLPDRQHHPRGWNTDRSHQRKVRSYQVETAWYRDWASKCDACCRVPACLALESDEDEFLMVFEDLDASGFPLRKSAVSINDMQRCLSWLAHFHATFLGETPRGLWEVGTYWHLDTRPDELEALADAPLKSAAVEIDAVLRAARFQTFVHGDAKLANFCFSEDGTQVAAVDFQYVGGGCGMKDVAYFIGSCLYEDACEQHEAELLDTYFGALNEALVSRGRAVDLKAIEQEWRALYPVAWTDFHRFMKGWSPGHWKIHGYSERLAWQVLAQLETAVSE
jgi:aminoglycoside phosphotransferase (APT) family kinase protein